MLRLILGVLLVLATAVIGYWLVSWILSALIALALVPLVLYFLRRRRK